LPRRPGSSASSRKLSSWPKAWSPPDRARTGSEGGRVTETTLNDTVGAAPAQGGAFADAAGELVWTLADEGVHCVFFNPGTDTAPVQEALARARSAGTPHPRSVLCLHEQVALAAAI